MPHFQKKMDLKLSVGVRYDAICIERLSQNRRTDRTNPYTITAMELDVQVTLKCSVNYYSQSSYFGTNAPYKWHHISLKLIVLTPFFSESET